jgi:hypothetical protein
MRRLNFNVVAIAVNEVLVVVNFIGLVAVKPRIYAVFKSSKYTQSD